jgi:hypothetical protein
MEDNYCSDCGNGYFGNIHGCPMDKVELEEDIDNHELYEDKD